ncbi:MAG: universal stress protein [Alphaproteobacteria bacterium]|nr:universal stress protein [Alphaproteobacteria bacterium]
MSYKTILLGLVAGEPRNEAIMNTAIGLAASQGAHVTALYMIPPFKIPVYDGVPFPSGFTDHYYANEEAAAAPVIEAFEAALKAQGDVTGEIRIRRKLPLDALRDNASCADLIVLGQPHENGHEPATDSLIGVIALSAGLPVLAVPWVGDYDSLGRNVLLAWTRQRESTRAAREVLPLLEAAERVLVLRVNPPDDGREAEIGAYLARHGVKVDIKDITVNDISIADAILNTVSDEGCDLIAMGAYGHSRVREYIFGGVTRDILRHMTVPTLFAH